MKNTIKFLFFFALMCTSLQAANRQMCVVSYNMRNDNSSDAAKGNGWSKRCPMITQMIRFHDFDLVGTQECKNNQINDLAAALPGYAYTGVGRDNGDKAGEYAAIFYKTDRFRLLDSGNFWLSQTPDVPGSIGWDAALTRICSWGKFKEQKTGFIFYFFNLHMDHVGKEARKQSANLVVEKIRTLTNGKPAVLTGDFNVNQQAVGYRILTQSGLLTDSYNAADIVYAPNGTMSDFAINNYTRSRIDHVFVTKHLTPLRYGVLTDNSWDAPIEKVAGTTSPNFPEEVEYVSTAVRMPSDHYPVCVILQY